MRSETMHLSPSLLSALRTGALAVIFLLSVSGCSDDKKSPAESETTVSYATDVQPVFDANCTSAGCHVPPFPAEGLDLTGYDALAASNTGNHILIPGDADNSEIIRRLMGTSTPQMPLGEDPLSAGTIDTIRTWINEGALDN